MCNFPGLKTQAQNLFHRLKNPTKLRKKKKKKLPQLMTKSGFTVHLNFSEVEAWICLYPPATVPDLLYLAAC